MSAPQRFIGQVPVTLIFGTISQPCKDKQGPNGPTNQWTVYVRNAQKQYCISPWVSSVTFNIHEDFANPQRVISQPPFSVQEVGWGEFVIFIQVNFHPCSLEPPLQLSVPLKLFVKPTELAPGVKLTDKLHRKQIVNEIVEEVIFLNPTVEFHNLLTTAIHAQPILQFDACLTEFIDLEFRNYETTTLRTASDTRAFVRYQTNAILHQMYLLRTQMAILNEAQRVQSGQQNPAIIQQPQQQPQQQPAQQQQPQTTQPPS